jgi:non-homologous end joining protein Ku
MLEIAEKIIDQQKGEFDSTQFIDRYEEPLHLLIEEKKSKPIAGGRPEMGTQLYLPAGWARHLESRVA